MIHYRFLFLTFLCFTVLITSAQPDVYSLKAVDSVYHSYIKTVQFYNAEDELSIPVIQRSVGTLHVGFDDHYGEYIDYYYTVVHCDRNWEFTTGVEISEYLEGPQEVQIEEFGSSISTIVNYTHYTFEFPNQDIRFNWTGNYLLVVYDADQTVAFTKRFYVVEETVKFLRPGYTRPNGVGEYYSHQSFNFELGIEKLDPLDPVNELFVTGFQNHFNERTLPFVKPFRVEGNQAIFSVGNQFTFPAYKEYREFDTREVLSGSGRRVNTIEISNTEATALLELDKNRAPKANFTLSEANGAFITRNEDRVTGDKNITSQYLNTIFTLRSPIEEEGDVYVLGAFNDFKAYPEYKMQFLPYQGVYTAEIPIKQGYYNYMYGMVTKNEAPDFFRFEGSSYETENRYHFLVYYRPLSGEYDQLVGYLNYPHQPR